MRRGSPTTIALALLLGATGCHTLHPRGVADCAPTDGCQNPEEIVVNAPQQRVIVKTPACPPDNCQTVTGAPQGVPQGIPQGVPQGLVGAPQGLMGYPQGVFGAQPMGVPFGTGGVSNATVTTNQRTRIALTTTTIRIPIPWLKLTPITDAPETTIKISGTQTAQAQGFGGMPMGVMPMGFGGGSLTGVPGSFIQGQVVGPPVSQGVVGVQGAAGPQGAAPQGAQPQGTGVICLPVDPNVITPERLQAMRKQIEELEAAKKAREDAKAKEAPAPKEK